MNDPLTANNPIASSEIPNQPAAENHDAMPIAVEHSVATEPVPVATSENTQSPSVESLVPGNMSYASIDPISTTPQVHTESASPISTGDTDIPVMKTAPQNTETSLHIPPESTTSAALGTSPEGKDSGSMSGVTVTAEKGSEVSTETPSVTPEVVQNTAEEITPVTPTMTQTTTETMPTPTTPEAHAAFQPSVTMPTAVVEATQTSNPIKKLVDFLRHGVLGQKATDVDKTVQSMRDETKG